MKLSKIMRTHTVMTLAREWVQQSVPWLVRLSDRPIHDLIFPE
jgi:hypothetical protein